MTKPHPQPLKMYFSFCYLLECVWDGCVYAAVFRVDYCFNLYSIFNIFHFFFSFGSPILLFFFILSIKRDNPFKNKDFLF